MIIPDDVVSDLIERLTLMAWTHHEESKHIGKFADCGSAVCEGNRGALLKAEGR